MSLNIFTFSGRLVDAPKSKEVNDSTVYNFSVAVNNYAGKYKEAEVFFVDCNLWGDRGRYLSGFDKGTEVSIVGKLTPRKWINKKGVEKTVLWCFVTDYEVHAKPTEEKKPRTRSAPKPKEENVDEDEEDDVPF